MKGIQMTIKLDVYAIKLSKENIQKLIDLTKPYGWTLNDLQDNREVNAEDGYDTMLFMKVYEGTTDIATFSDEISDPSLANPYRLTEETDPIFGLFHKVEKI
jgi:hypothetical protein